MPVLATVVVLAQFSMGALAYVLFKRELLDQLSDIRARLRSRPMHHGKTVHRYSAARRARADTEALKTVIIFCGLGLSISLLCAKSGLDLSGGF